MTKEAEAYRKEAEAAYEIMVAAKKEAEAAEEAYRKSVEAAREAMNSEQD